MVFLCYPTYFLPGLTGAGAGLAGAGAGLTGAGAGFWTAMDVPS